MLTYHHEKYVQIYLMVLLTKSTTVFLFLVVHLFNPLIAKPHYTITQQTRQGCLVVNTVVQENPQHIPEMTVNNRNIFCQNQFFLLNISVSHLMSSKWEKYYSKWLKMSGFNAKRDQFKRQDPWLDVQKKQSWRCLLIF